MTTNYAVMLRNPVRPNGLGGGGAGTVTSVGVQLSDALAALLAVSGSPVTTAGDIDLDLQPQAANRVFASPIAGDDGFPAFRMLVSDDIPSLSASKITSGVFSTAQIPNLAGTYSLVGHSHDASAIVDGTLDNARLSSSVVLTTAIQTLTNKSIAASQLTGTLPSAQFPALTGDVTTSAGSLATTLATVNGNVGSFALASVTVNEKGLVTAAAAAEVTGSGSVVLASSPAIVTPTIASLTNAQHNHQDAAGGGQLSAAAVSSGIFDNARINWGAPSAIGGTTPAAITGTAGAFSSLTLNTTGSATGQLRIRASTGNNGLLFQRASDSVNVFNIADTGVINGGSAGVVRFDDNVRVENPQNGHNFSIGGLFIWGNGNANHIATGASFDGASTWTRQFTNYISYLTLFSSSTNTGLRLLRTKATSGTPEWVNFFEAGMTGGTDSFFKFYMPSATNDNREIALLTTLWHDNTDASRSGDLIFSAYYTANAREVIRIRGGASSGLLGFFGTTPAGQQTGGAATAGGTYGATEQAMLQKVYDMARTFGLLS